MATYFISAVNISPGPTNAPIVVDNTVLCTNLNADLLDGVHASAFHLAPTGTPDGTKFLRDDNTWQAVGSSGAVIVTLIALSTPQAF